MRNLPQSQIKNSDCASIPNTLHGILRRGWGMAAVSQLSHCTPVKSWTNSGRRKKKKKRVLDSNPTSPIPSKLQEASLTTTTQSHFLWLLVWLCSVIHPFYVFLPVCSTSPTQHNFEARYIFSWSHLHPNGYHTFGRSVNYSSWEQFRQKLLINLADKMHRLYWGVCGGLVGLLIRFLLSYFLKFNSGYLPAEVL